MAKDKKNPYLRWLFVLSAHIKKVEDRNTDGREGDKDPGSTKYKGRRS